MLEDLPGALKKAFDWRGLLTLFLAICGATSLVARAFGVMLNNPTVQVLPVYDWLRDGISAPVSALAIYLGLVFPHWLKDAAFVYAPISRSVWRTIASYTKNDTAKRWFSWLRWPSIGSVLRGPTTSSVYGEDGLTPLLTYRRRGRQVPST